MAAYMKFDGIDGECVAKGHEKWCELGTFSQHLFKTGAGKTGVARQEGTIQLEDVQCSKLLDKSSPKIIEAVCLGKIFPKVEIHVLTTGVNSGREPYLKYELKNVMVTSHTISGHDQDRPGENYSLNFEEYKLIYTEMSEKGEKKGDVAFGWKVREGVKV